MVWQPLFALTYSCLLCIRICLIAIADRLLTELQALQPQGVYSLSQMAVKSGQWFSTDKNNVARLRQYFGLPRGDP